jgi:hypothetical protein
VGGPAIPPASHQIVFFGTDSSGTGGMEAHGHLELGHAVPTSQTAGLSIELSSSDAGLIQFPQGNANVHPGSSKADFNFLSTPVSTPTKVKIYASLGGASKKSSEFTILPTLLKGMSVSPNNIPGGKGATGTLVFTGPPPSSGAIVVKLTSDNPAVLRVDPTATLPANRTEVPFNLQATTPEAQTPVTVTASYSPPAWAPTSKNPPEAGKFGNLQSRSYSFPVTVGATPIASNAYCYYPCQHESITVTLPSPAPAGGAKLVFTSPDGSLYFPQAQEGSPETIRSQGLPPVSITIPAGQTAGAIQYNYMGGPYIGRLSYTPEQRHQVDVNQPHPHYQFSYAGKSYVGTVAVWPEIRPDLYVWKLVLTDRFANDISSSGPIDGEPFTMCANVSAVGDLDHYMNAWGHVDPTLPFTPTVLKVVFPDIQGDGHEYDFPITDALLGSWNYVTTSPCIKLPGLLKVNDSYKLSLTIDPGHTIVEEFYNNNTRNFTITRKQ